MTVREVLGGRTQSVRVPLVRVVRLYYTVRCGVDVYEFVGLENIQAGDAHPFYRS